MKYPLVYQLCPTELPLVSMNYTYLMRPTPIMCLVISFLTSVCLVGCRGGVTADDALANANQTNIQRLANLYTNFQSRHRWNGPTNEAAFKEFIRGLDSEKLARIGVEPGHSDDLFIGERDGQPFKIRYSINGSPRGCSEPAIFESTGRDGKRLVGFLNMVQREVDDAEYEKLWSGEISEPLPPTNPLGR